MSLLARVVALSSLEDRSNPSLWSSPFIDSLCGDTNWCHDWLNCRHLAANERIRISTFVILSSSSYS